MVVEADRPVDRPSYVLTRRLFLCGLGVVYLIAFASLAVQIVGLAGRDGIAPVTEMLGRVAARAGAGRYLAAPTVFWIDARDRTLEAVCWAGSGAALLLILDIAPLPALVILWVLYLSVQTSCDVFLYYQWDILLLEAGFLAIFLAPLHLRPVAPVRPRRETIPSRPVLWTLRLLVFRLMLLSGLVKWLSGDTAWRELTALEYHYETQPLPPWTAWYAHQLPGWAQRVSVATMFVVELVVPFFIFAPRPLRLAACAALVVFQGTIMATGNYGFFNLLTIVLCLTLLDDGVWPRRWRERYAARRPAAPGRPPHRWPAALTASVACVLVLLSVPPAVGRLGLAPSWPAPLRTALAWAQPFRIANAYGLFTVMTKRRAEIRVQGSADGRTWRSYEFRWKPGDPSEAPRFVEPHQPRLDWQMWFAALGTFDRQFWFQRFLLRLLAGSPEVLALLRHNPFPDTPPRYVRAIIAEFRFTDYATKKRQGRWWHVGPERPYSPILSGPPGPAGPR
jgi:uncharacterized membrane protein YphA (DoxX/SURF4 family)